MPMKARIHILAQKYKKNGKNGHFLFTFLILSPKFWHFHFFFSTFAARKHL